MIREISLIDNRLLPQWRLSYIFWIPVHLALSVHESTLVSALNTVTPHSLYQLGDFILAHTCRVSSEPYHILPLGQSRVQIRLQNLLPGVGSDRMVESCDQRGGDLISGKSVRGEYTLDDRTIRPGVVWLCQCTVMATDNPSLRS